MRRFDLILIIIGAALFLLIAAFGVRVAEHYPAARAELARVKLMQLDDEIRARLGSMQHDAVITYYVSSREKMPSSMRRMERDVADILEAMKSASRGRLDYQIVRPEQGVERAPGEARRILPQVKMLLDRLENQSDAADLTAELQERFFEAISKTGVTAQEAGRRAQAVSQWLVTQYQASADNSAGLTDEVLAQVVEQAVLDAGQSLVQHAVHQRVSPFRMRTVAHDAYADQTIWSSLHIAYGPHAPAVVNGVSPEHLPRLQSLIIGQVEQKDEPRRPIFGIAANPSVYSQFSRWLSRHGEVVEVDLDQPFPDEVDVLFWFDPTDVPSPLLRRLDEFISSGRSVVIAGSRHDVRHLDGWEFEFRATDYDADALLSAFGLRAIDDLVLDRHSLAVPGEVAPMPAQFLIRCIGHNQDFRALGDHPNGHLLFTAPTPFAFDSEVLAQRRFTPTILATTSDGTSVGKMRYGKVRLDASEVWQSEPAPKLPLTVLLRPDEPWRGSVLFAASSAAFRNDWFVHENFAHRRLADVIVGALASDERLVIHRLEVDQPQMLPEMATTQRLFWRIVCILLIPAALVLVAWRRGAFRSSGEGPRTRIAIVNVSSGLAVHAVAGILIVVLLAAATAALGLRTDLTQGQLNRLAPHTRMIAANAVGERAVLVNLYFSRDEHLPPSMRPMLRRLRAVLDELRAVGADLDVRTHFPDDLEGEGRDALAARGIEPVRAVSHDEEVTTVRNIYCSVEFISAGASELLHFPDRDSFDTLEFRVAFALWRLQTGRQPHIAFIADIPRLSSAEMYHDFQQQNLFAPTGADVHAHARRLLEQAGFRITHVNPQSRALPDVEFDLILWMQPRRDILPLLQQTIERLHDGTPVLLAAQHFVIQSRQFSGDTFRMAYWPQPQVADLERFYLPELGAELVHEVVFDDVRAAMAIESQVRQSQQEREYGEQVSALPFLIRALASNFDTAHPLMRGLGDQVLPFASYIRLDPQRLESFGLRALPLITTSERSWTYNWTGGYLYADSATGHRTDLLTGAERDDAGERQWAGRLPLAVLIEGRFPLPEEPLTNRDIQSTEPLTFSDSVGKESRLILIGNSYMFRNERLTDPDFRADHLLLNAAAFLALDEPLAAIAGHRRVAPGFNHVEERERLMWRGVVVSAGPALLMVFGVMWWSARRIPSGIARRAREASIEAK